MEATPARLKAILKAIFWLFTIGSVLGFGLFIYSVIQGQYAWAVMSLGFFFSMLATAVNPNMLFRKFREQALSGSVTNASINAHRYLTMLMWICYIGALVMFLIGKFRA